MNRRSFLKLSPAFPTGAVSAALVLRQDGQAPLELDVSVLKTQPGDIIVLSTTRPMPADDAMRIKAYAEHAFPTLKAIVMGDGLKIDGIIRP